MAHISNTYNRGHQEHDAPSGEASIHYMGMVHAPISIEMARGIPLAWAAVEKEWTKLENKGAWDTSKVQERAWVEGNRTPGKKIYFGKVRDLCHQKHDSEDPE